MSTDQGGGQAVVGSEQGVLDVAAWPDDPMSGLDVEHVGAPELTPGPLAISINGPQPPPGVYDADTPEFLYWEAAVALTRAADFWTAALPAGTTWQPGTPLPISLDEGEDLNAFYDRVGLSFFHGTAAGTTVFSAASGDVTNHELGHAVLDALRPDLWDAMSIEAAAFHEAFGDMSAIMSAISVPQMRAAVLAQAASGSGSVRMSSPLSRLAEQLGWAIRQGFPDAVDADCLRNAMNSFSYQSPERLPSSAPASGLSSEPHSFSRVFTGAFYDAWAGMVAVDAPTPTDDGLLSVTADMGRLLAAGAAGAAIVPDFFAQVAAHMIEADARLFAGKYHDVLTRAFVRRGIISGQSTRVTRGLVAAMVPGQRSAPRPEGALRRMTASGELFGLQPETIAFLAPEGQERRFAVASAALDHGSADPSSAESAALSFVSDLARRGRIDTSALGRPAGGAPGAGAHGMVGFAATPATGRRRSTHAVVPEDGEMVLRRICID